MFIRCYSFYNKTPTTINTLSLHDALPISHRWLAYAKTVRSSSGHPPHTTSNQGNRGPKPRVRFLRTPLAWLQQARAHLDRACPLAGPRICPFAIARLRYAAWGLSERQFRPQPGSAGGPAPNHSCQCFPDERAPSERPLALSLPMHGFSLDPVRRTYSRAHA